MTLDSLSSVIEREAVAHPVDQPDLRVIVVGRTELESSLRLDARIEVIRARTTLLAIGELSDPADGPAGRESLVLVGTDAHSGLDIRRFVTAVRLVDPSARVMLVASRESHVEAKGYDAVIDPAASSETIRELLRRAHGGSGRQQVVAGGAGNAVGGASAAAAASANQLQVVSVPAHGGVAAAAEQAARTAAEQTLVEQGLAEQVAEDVSGPASGQVTEQAASTAGAGGGLGVEAVGQGFGEVKHSVASHLLPPIDAADDDDVLAPMTMTAGVDVSLDTALVQAALVGRDVLAPAMSVLRAHLGNSGLGEAAAEHVVFVPLSAGEPAGGIRAEVRHRDRVFGWLAGPLTLPVLLLPVLRNQADWLACWLALSHQQTELRRAALVDDLTGAWNRRYFERFLQAALERAQGQRHTLSVLVIDIDNFKYFNDRFGHAAGDEILKETVRLLKSVIRSGDRVCRIGGDELAVVFYEPSGPRESGSRPLESIEQITARFQKQIAEARFPKLGPQAPGKLTVSGGLATYPWDGRTVAELVAHADDLAMSTKRAGKNKITFGPHAGEEAPGSDGA